MIKYLLVLLVAMAILAGCVPSKLVTETPEYILLLTQQRPDTGSRCSGVVLSPTVVVTVKHCAVYMTRGVTVHGQVLRLTPTMFWYDTDLAVLSADEEIKLTKYPIVRTASPFVLATHFGFCPWQMDNTPRILQYYMPSYFMGEAYPLDHWIVVQGQEGFGERTCGGDSGGPVVQNFLGEEYLVGLIVGVIDEDTPGVTGVDTFTIPGRLLTTLLTQKDVDFVYADR